MSYFDDRLAAAIATIERDVEAALVSISQEHHLHSEDVRVRAATLGDALRARAAQYRREMEDLILETFRQHLAPAMVPQSGTGCLDRMKSQFRQFLQQRSAAIFRAIAAKMRELLTADLLLLKAEVERQMAAAATVLSDLALGTRGGSAAAGTGAGDPLLVRLRAAYRAALLPLSTPSPAAQPAAPPPAAPTPPADDFECQLNFDGPVTGRVQGCTCTQPRVCIACFRRLLNATRDHQHKCPYCQQPYDLSIGYREGDFTVHPTVRRAAP